MWGLVVYGVTLLDHTFIEWYMTMLVVKMGHQIGTCCDEITLYAQNMDVVLGSIIFSSHFDVET
jgi:hypothetical protein